MQAQALRHLQAMQLQMEEHADRGQPVTVYLGVNRPVPVDEVAEIQQRVQQAGLRGARVRYGSFNGADALEITFRRPSRGPGAALLPLPVILVGGLGALTIIGILGFTVASQVSRNIVPLAIILGLTIVAITVAQRKS